MAYWRNSKHVNVAAAECLSRRGTRSDLYFKTAVPNFFGTTDRFCGRQFFHRWGGVVMVQAVMQALVQAVMQAMGSDGEQQMKLLLLARCLPPAVRPCS